MNYFPRQKLFSSLLLLSVVAFSLNSAMHWWWHCGPSCYNTAHSSRTETLGNTGPAWQRPIQAPLDYEHHCFNCPLCAGMVLAGNCPAGMPMHLIHRFTTFFLAPVCDSGITAQFSFPARGPPAVA